MERVLAATGPESGGLIVGSGRAFGTFGELLQGVLPDTDLDFLVTFPVDRWTTAVFRPRSSGPRITVSPPHKVKAQRLARIVMDTCGLPGGGELELTSDLPEGKGFASSSADLVATARAIGDAFGIHFDEEAIESFLRGVEPSDGVMYEGVVAFYHRAVRLRERLGRLPELTVVAHDEGGEIDTIGFNRIPKPFSPADKEGYGEQLAVLAEAIRGGDLRTVGRVATWSAEMNGRLRRRGHLEDMRRLCAEIEGFGLVLAHSGTMLGILLAGDDTERDSKIAHVRASCAPWNGSVSVHRSLPATTP
ncbi:kinase [Kitasatospora sp. NPDC058162]|uniref:GHMP family kinase ATP-binding protein n=1 Tax=Kitasatospora sp. NPDC058162 TaxID=3346362 RepID=UPI0036DD51F8